MRLDLDTDDGRFLHAQLKRRLSELEIEVVHTDDHAMHRALLADIARLEALVKHVEGSLEAEADNHKSCRSL
jgi:hypothetical protein